MKILTAIVDDREFQDIQDILKGYFKQEALIDRVLSAESVTETIASDPPDVIMLHYMLPDCSGVQLLQQLTERQCNIPIIMITGQNDEKEAALSIAMGAYDYLLKEEINLSVLPMCVDNVIKRKKLEGDIMSASLKIKEMTIIDWTTGVYNRRYLFDILDKEIERAKRFKSPLSILMVGVNEMTSAREEHGRDFADYVLRELAQIFQCSLRTYDILTRSGNNEFCVILPNTNLGESRSVGARLNRNVHGHEFGMEDGETMKLSISAGISILGSGAQAKSEMLCYGERALSKARSLNSAQGRN